MGGNNKIKRSIVIISAILFLFSLTQKCYCTTSQCGDSIMAFLLGWFAVLTGGAGISWIANPLLFTSWIVFRKNIKISFFLSLLATLFAFSFLLFDTILANEAGHYQQIISYKAGYWLWVSSSVSMLAGTFLVLLKQKTNNAS